MCLYVRVSECANAYVACMKRDVGYCKEAGGDGMKGQHIRLPVDG